MNLLEDPPFELVRRDGTRERVPFARIAEPQWVDIWAPRADFRGAAFQFAVGVLQSACAPAELEDWEEAWKTPPDAHRLAALLAPYSDAFEFDREGKAFMQDGDLPEAEAKSIAGLLIDAPGEKTIRDNLDHFVKRGSVTQMCPHCAASALFTLQINAPSGGAGHRVSLRGGGPLTTLLVPADANASIWHKLWLNVLPGSALRYGEVKAIAEVLAWMGPTRTSDGKAGGVDTTPESVHPLQAYWSMPRRIRLDFEQGAPESCGICGVVSQQMVRSYRTRNYGVNYTGAWMHPLTPYSLDPKTGPLSLKGQRGGIGYRHWLGLTIGSRDESGPVPARVVQHFNQHLYRLPQPRLWCFGYDMDNMKARCWYDSTLPVYAVEPDRQESYVLALKSLVDVATEAASLLGRHAKAARFARPKDAPSDPALSQGFWQATESLFYSQIQRLMQTDTTDEQALWPIYYHWLTALRRHALQLFDQWVRSVPIDEANTRRVVEQREELAKWLSASKPMKALWKIVNANRNTQEAA